MQPDATFVPASELIRQWRTWMLGERSLSKRTDEVYAWRIDYLLRLCDRHPLEVTTADLRTHMLQTCPKANTKGAALRAFRSFFGFLHAEGWRQDDPSRAIRQPRIPDSLPKYLDDDEARRLDQAAYFEGVEMHALCRLYLYEGLRAAEGVRLAWRNPAPPEDPDGMCTGVVNVRGGWILVRGKGAKERELPIVPKVREALVRLYKYRNHDVWLFPRKPNVRRPGQENLPMSVSGVQQAVKRWSRAADVDTARVSVHKLRHTFATSYLASGADITYVQRALGHSTIEMTMRYARVRSEVLAKTMKRIKY